MNAFLFSIFSMQGIALLQKPLFLYIFTPITFFKVDSKNILTFCLCNPDIFFIFKTIIMSQTIIEKEIVASESKNTEAYFETHDVKYLADNPVFINMGTGEETRGREEVAEMLHFIYHIAFDAKPEIRNKIITDNNAVLEFNFTGKHIGEFAGIAPSNRNVDVPCIVLYDLENGKIKTARIYMMLNVLMQQIKGN